MFETLLVSSVVIKLMLLLWLKNLNKYESKCYFCNSRILNNNIESVHYLVYICFKVLSLQILDILEPIKSFFKLQISELIYKVSLVCS